MISSTVFPIISDGNFGTDCAGVPTETVVPLLEATTGGADTRVALVVVLDPATAVEVELREPADVVAVVDRGSEDDDAGAVVFVESEKLGNEVEALVVLAPKPEKEVAAVEAAAPEAVPAVEPVVKDEEPIPKPVNGDVEAADCVELVAAAAVVVEGAELVVVVTVENKAVEELPNSAGLEAGVDAAGVDEAPAAALEVAAVDDPMLPKPNEG